VSTGSKAEALAAHLKASHRLRTSQSLHSLFSSAFLFSTAMDQRTNHNMLVKKKIKKPANQHTDS
jgi:hypothetical protein